jgi:two-component sensor histidine kinase
MAGSAPWAPSPNFRRKLPATEMRRPPSGNGGGRRIANTCRLWGTEMCDELQANAVMDATGNTARGSWLLVEEMAHRVINEYSMAISSLSLAASRSSNPQARMDLLRAASQLRDFADAHRRLQMPIVGATDLLDYLGEICGAMARATLNERGVSLTLRGNSMVLEGSRCRIAGLIVSELVLNALRHGLNGRSGAIAVEVLASADDVQCRVGDNGVPSANARPGRGSTIIAGLASQLGGSVERYFGGNGTLAILSFPRCGGEIEDEALLLMPPGAMAESGAAR